MKKNGKSPMKNGFAISAREKRLSASGFQLL
jgi:hypothetical protein